MPTEVIGRDDEVERLRAFLDPGLRDQPRALVLEGEAGIGKSTLWLRGVDLARERGFRVLSSRPAEKEQNLAFAGLGDLIEAVMDDVLPALPLPRRHALEVALLMAEAQEPIDPRALGVAVRTALELLAAEQPLLLAVDDVQWLDGSSANALAFALRRVTLPLHVLLARRQGDRQSRSELELALPAQCIAHLAVGPLSAGAIQTLLRQRLERVLPRPALLRIHETSGGNPFYALELARVLPHQFDASQPLPVPEELEGLIRARIEALPEPCRQALVFLSAIGEGNRDTLRRAGVEDSLEPAISHGIVERTADRLRFTHPLLASSAYEAADDGTRRTCHAVLAEVIGDRLERARHLALSVQGPDPQIAAVADEAADLASAQGATAAAVPLRGHALRLTPPGAEDHTHRRTIALVRARDAAGEPPSSLEPLASALLDRAAPGVPRAQALLLNADLAPDLGTSLALRRRAIEEARDDPALQARIHRLLAWDVRFVEGDLEASERHARASLAIADRLEDDALRAAGLVVLSTIRFHMAKPDAVRLGTQGHALARVVADPEQLVWDTLTFSSTLIWSGDLDGAQMLLEPLHREWSARDESVAQQTLWRFGCIELLAGRLDAAADFAESSLEICEAYEVSDAAPLWAVAQIAAWRGDLDRARSVIERARQSPNLTPWFIPHVETVLGQVALWTGDAAAAIEHFSRAEDLRAAGSLEPRSAAWRADYAEALVQVGRTEEAVLLLDSWEAEATRLGRGAVLAQVTRCRGLVAAARGDVAAAGILLEGAVDEHDSVGDALGRARALLALGVVRRRARQRGDARKTIEEAVAAFDECGARGWAQRARGELGRISGRTREKGLTAAEQRVAALVAEGRTNREVAGALFLGERTVETHLTRIYAKLGVRSRIELARVYEPAS